MLDILSVAEQFAHSNVTILLTGETGTGKGVLARFIHEMSPRSRGPFVQFPCASIPQELLENELYGHEEGAYTDARKPSKGHVAAARGGTLFLDEIDMLPVLAQAKLLHLLQEKEYHRLGSDQVSRSDVRIVCATNADLGEAVKTGRFREDLYFRVRVAEIAVPPLRERRDDILPLARYFLRKYSEEGGASLEGLTDDVEKKLLNFDWPGNVRELEHVIQCGVIRSRQDDHLLAALPLADNLKDDHPASEEPDASAKKKILDRSTIQSVLLRHDGNISQSARELGIDRKTLRKFLKSYDLDLSPYPVKEA
jgi:transcriptional regulator with PAS, ATPase and Fis domain